jgi:glucokinase
VGTGFGAAAAVVSDDGVTVVSGEPGHMVLTDPAYGVETVEEALSGAGVLRLYRQRGGVQAQTSSAVLASATGDPIARVVADDLARLMGRVAGDLALALGAWGGVYFTGSVALALLDSADQRLVREAFAAKGAMRARMTAVPVHRLTVAEPALIGLSHVAL